METNLPAVLDEITRRIRAISDPERIVLFGSYGRGDARADSDLDVRVIKDEIESTRLKQHVSAKH